MRTIHQIVQDHIARSAALVNDSMQMSVESNRLMMRLSNRMHSDPSLAAFTAHFAGALTMSLKILPETLHQNAIQSLLLQAIVDWEDVHTEFGAQLKPARLG
jgi:hypothetical protein